ncbi:hypothetical protein STEG23_016523 [Scotinomys teguina]
MRCVSETMSSPKSGLGNSRSVPFLLGFPPRPLALKYQNLRSLGKPTAVFYDSPMQKEMRPSNNHLHKRRKTERRLLCIPPPSG